MDETKTKSNVKTRSSIKLPEHGNFTVGHGKPPEATRFKPGQSGNPKGRPKGKLGSAAQSARSTAIEHERMKSIILKEAYRTIKVNDGAAQVNVPMAQAVIRSLAVTAAKGNTRAQKLFSELLSKTELANKRADDEWLQTMITYKCEWEMELQRRKLMGQTNLADPLPHPDDVIVDYRKNTVIVHGPMDKREQADLDLWLKRRHENEVELEQLKKDKTAPEFEPYGDQLDGDIVHTKRILEIINTTLDILASKACVERRMGQLKFKTPDVKAG